MDKNAAVIADVMLIDKKKVAEDVTAPFCCFSDC